MRPGPPRLVVKLWKDPDDAYFRIRDKALFPSLKNTDVTFLYDDFLEVNAKEVQVKGR
jgi:hypothetical protein